MDGDDRRTEGEKMIRQLWKEDLRGCVVIKEL